MNSTVNIGRLPPSLRDQVKLWMMVDGGVFDVPEEIRYIANFEPPQYTLGKTSKTLNHIDELLKRWGTEHLKYSEGGYNITVVVTSCNLAETAQWRCRVEGKFNKKKYINICTLSSKTKTTKSGDSNNLGSFLCSLTLLKEEDLPNILIMCCHPARVSRDCVNLLQSCNRLHVGTDDVSSICPHRPFTFNFMFDEVDKSQNQNLVIRFIKEVQEKHKKYIKQIHFITATPVKKFTQALIKLGINKIENIDKNGTWQRRKEADEEYQSILTHPAIYKNGPKSPLDYIKSFIDDQSIIKMNERNIIFAPGEHYTSTHEEISTYFRENFGYYVFMHSGKFKGFVSPDGEEITVDDYKEEFKIKGELRDVFRDFRRRFMPANESLVITGYNTIKRGITFNTDGFNFTHMFVSDYHGKHLNELVQLLGRACGNKKYCDKIKIVIPKPVMDKAQIFVRNLMNLKNSIPETFDMYSDFSNNKKKQEMFILRFKSQRYFIKREFFKNEIKPELKDTFNDKSTKRKRGPKKRAPDLKGKYSYSFGPSYQGPKTYKEVYDRRQTSANRGATFAAFVPCYETRDFKDDSLEFWLIIPKAAFKENSIMLVRNNWVAELSKNRSHWKYLPPPKNWAALL